MEAQQNSNAGGGGRFVNRVPDFDEPFERAERGCPFPDGDFICAECDEKAREEVEP